MAIIQARLGSTRLPKKVLTPINGKTMLMHVIERVNMATLVDEVVVAVPVTDAEEIDNAICNEEFIFPGDGLDVLSRYYHCAKRFDAKHVVRITADCPMMDPTLIDTCVKLHLESGADYTSNVIKRTYPDGQDVEVFTMAALARTYREAKEQYDREHVTPYMRNEDKFKLSSVEGNYDRSLWRWTVDTAEDLANVEYILRCANLGSYASKM